MLGRRTPRTSQELLDIATNHVDGEEAVAATLNTPQGKDKEVVNDGEGPSLRPKKKRRTSVVVTTTLWWQLIGRWRSPKNNPA
jgi:hypothetical protein